MNHSDKTTGVPAEDKDQLASKILKAA